MARDARASVIGVDSATPRLLPNPGGPTQVRRQFVALTYIGIAAQMPPIVIASLGITWNFFPSTTTWNMSDSGVTWNFQATATTAGGHGAGS